MSETICNEAFKLPAIELRSKSPESCENSSAGLTDQNIHSTDKFV